MARSNINNKIIRGNFGSVWLNNEKLAEAKKVAPTLFFNAGASCVNTGRCPEGAMACGKLSEMLKMREKE